MGRGVDAVCIVQWITALIVPLEGYTKKKKKKECRDGEDKGWLK